ncbi:MAG: tetratricopeptide repeat protein [Thermodesulfobacteriota bacterium]
MAKKEKLVEKAQKFIQKGQLDKAIIEYQAVMKLDPADVSTRLRLGDLNVKTGNKEEALKEYTEVAKVHTQKGFYLKAIAVYKQMLKLDDSSLELHNKLADLYIKQRLIVDAIREYSFILAVYEKKARKTDALDLIKKMVELDKENVGVRLKLADAYLGMDFKEDALVEYSWAFDKLFKQNKIDKAEKVYGGIYDSYPKELKVVEGLVEVYKKKADGENLSKYGSDLVDIYKDNKENEKAMALCEEILKVNPGADVIDTTLRELKIAGGILAPEKAAPPPPPPPPAPAPPEEPAIEVTEEEAIEVIEEVSVPAIEVEAEVPAVEEPMPGPEQAAETAGEEELKVEIEEPTAEEEAVEVIEEEPSVEVEAEEEEFKVELDEDEELPVIDDAEEIEPVDELEELKEVVVEDLMEVYPEKEEGGEGGGRGDDGGFVDLASELGLEDALEGFIAPWAEGESDHAAEEFKDGMGKQLSREDTETHYNLGIAYMEMELFSEAINEFKIAMKDSALEFDCYTRLGLCETSEGAPDEAIGHYLKALKTQGRSEEEMNGVMYELALAYEAAGRVGEAVDMFNTVHERDPDYREVSEKVKELVSPASGIPADDAMLEVEIL